MHIRGNLGKNMKNSKMFFNDKVVKDDIRLPYNTAKVYWMWVFRSSEGRVWWVVCIFRPADRVKGKRGSKVLVTGSGEKTCTRATNLAASNSYHEGRSLNDTVQSQT
jgi:hypothetical protein